MDLKKWQFVVSGALLMLALVACDNQKQAATAPEAAAPAQEAAAPATELGLPLKGKAKEVHAGGGFTYVLVASEAGETWVAVPETEVQVDEEVTVAEGQLMQNFPSKSLDRTFAELIFSPGLVGKQPKESADNPHAGGAMTSAAGGSGEGFGAAMQKEAGAAPVAADPSSQVAMGSGKAVVPSAELKIEKAKGANAYTVAELFTKSKELNTKKVKVKGQVVKVSPGIMGKNWLHIQDGTGDAAQNTHDLVVTTSGEAEKGAIVTVEGVLAADKDFGFGYKYNVIVEDVTVTR